MTLKNDRDHLMKRIHFHILYAIHIGVQKQFGDLIVAEKTHHRQTENILSMYQIKDKINEKKSQYTIDGIKEKEFENNTIDNEIYTNTMSENNSLVLITKEFSQ